MVDRRLHFNWHHHPEYELLICTSGAGQAHIGDLVAGFEGPAAFFITGDLPHGFASDGTIHGWIVQFPPRNLGSLEGRPESVDVSKLIEAARKGVRFGTGASVAAALRLQELESQAGLSLWLGIIGLLDELSRDAELALCSYAARPPASDASDSLDAFDAVVSSLFDGAADYHNLRDASRSAGMSVSTFCRTFKRRVGLSFVEYLHSIRINTAKKLLIQTGLCVDDICYECGFNNVSFFDRKFKQLTGMTPSRYRRTYGAASEERRSEAATERDA
jgi:AraC-like DNA-binding protein